MSKRPDPELTDDENPELDEEWFRSSRPAAEVLPDILPPEVVAELVGGPVSKGDVVPVAIEEDIVTAFRSTGQGWDARINAVLRDWLREHEGASRP